MNSSLPLLYSILPALLSSSVNGVVCSSAPSPNVALALLMPVVKKIRPPSNISEAIQWNVIQAYSEALLDAKCLLPMTQGKTIEEALLALLKNNLEIEIPSVQLQMVPGKFQNRLSGNAIYQVIDTAKEPILFLKVYKKQPSVFLEELSALTHIESLPLKNSSPAHLLTVGQIEVENEKYPVLVETAAPGKSIEHFLEKVHNAPLDSQERTDAFNEALHILNKLGSALAELHTIQKAPKMFFSPSLLHLVKYEVDQFCQKIKQHPIDGIEEEQLLSYFSFLHKEFEQEAFEPGYVHGDAYFSNFFYDNKVNQVTMIDFTLTNYSINSEGSPIGIPAWDYLAVADHLRNRYLLGDFSEMEYQRLEEFFRRGYIAQGGIEPTQRQRQFLEFIQLLLFVGTFIGELDQFPDQSRAIINRLLEEKMQRLSKKLFQYR